jgi:chemotaxis protein CheX
VNAQNDALIAAVLERNTRTMSSPSSDLSSPSDDLPEAQTAPVISKAELLSGCLLESIRSVFQTMCGMAVEVDDSNESHQHHVSGIISLSGEVKATLVFSLHQDVVFAAADGMLGIKPTEFDADVVDLVGELSNMVVGNAKERMKLPGVSLGLPTVVLGGQHEIAYRSNVTITILRFKSQFGPLVIEFGMA